MIAKSKSMYNGGTMDTGYKDFECTICYDIFLYPVCLPCKHRFCKACLDKHLDNNTMCCPICRFRVSNWLRQLRRSNADIVDKPFWEKVQKLYPLEVEKRINGKIDYETSSPENDIPIRRIAKPGEIHQEYELFLQKELEEKRQKDEENFRLSERMIRMIEEDEKREQLERLEQLRRDEELAKQLAQEAGAGSGEAVQHEDEKREQLERLEQLRRDEELAKQLAQEAGAGSGEAVQHLPYPSSCCSPHHSPRREKCLDSPSTSRDPGTSFCLHVTPPTSRDQCQSPVVPLDTQSMSRENIFAKFWTSTPSSKRSSHGTSSHQEPSTSSDTKSSSISNQTLSHFAPVRPGPTQGPKDKKSKEAPSTSRCSSGSDSIGQELNHFKPIRSSPTTPPKEGSRGLLPKVVVPQRGVNKTCSNMPIPHLDLLAANVSLDELETSMNLEKQLEEDRELAKRIQSQFDQEMKLAVKADYNLRKRKRPSGNSKKRASLDGSQTTLDNLLIK